MSEDRRNGQTYYRWRKEYGGMGTEQLKRLKELEKENARLKRVVADLIFAKGVKFMELSRHTFLLAVVSAFSLFFFCTPSVCPAEENKTLAGTVNSASVPNSVTFSGRWVIDPVATRALLKERGIITDDPEETKDLLIRGGFGIEGDPEEYFQTLFDEFWWQFDFSALKLVERSTLDYFPAVPFTLKAKPGQLSMVYTSKVYGETTTATFEIMDGNTILFNREVEDNPGFIFFPLILVRDIQQNYSGEWQLRDVDTLVQDLSAAVDWKDLGKARQMLQELRLVLKFSRAHAGSVEWKFLNKFPDFLHNGRCRVVPMGRNGRKLIFNDGWDSYGLGGAVTLVFDGPDTIRYTPMWGFTAAEFVRVK